VESRPLGFELDKTLSIRLCEGGGEVRGDELTVLELKGKRLG
jgi:hypothetical protein